MEADVIRISKRLKAFTEAGDINNANESLDLLKALKTQKITLDILQSTRIGIVVNNYRKSGSSNSETGSLAKHLIKAWKKLLPDKPSDSAAADKTSSSSSSSTNNSASVSNNNETTAASSASSSPKDVEQDDDTANPVRLKCRQMIYNALQTTEPIESTLDSRTLSRELETCIYNDIKNTEMKYRNRIRSRVSNLKDVRNPDLKRNVLLGRIPADALAVMTAEEMASEEMKKVRQMFTKDSINDSQLAQTSGTQTSLLKCGKCGKRNCTYNQAQTRSADEPMTTFVFCNHCGNRWKFC